MTRRLEVRVDHSLCVGNGTCLVIAPQVFAHNANQQSEVIDPAGDTEETIVKAAAICPVAAIQVMVGETREQLFPLAYGKRTSSDV